MHNKLQKLQESFKDMGSCLIAFSGGIDSTFLLRVAADVLGKEKVVALIGRSPTYQQHFFKDALDFVNQLAVKKIIVETNELQNAHFSSNPPNRCYYCKHELFSQCRKFAHELNLAYVLDGFNADDTSDYRPGMMAKKELEIRSPLMEVGLTKQEIRALSKEMGIASWNKPATVCLASRFPYGTALNLEKLAKIERCENILQELGFREYRVRYHDNIARIEYLKQTGK